MAENSTIEWTDATWNPVTGCSRVSPGCAHCYAERLAPKVFAGQTVVVQEGGGECSYRPRVFTDVRCHASRLQQPLRWRKPRKVFVNSMSDLFHEDVPDAFIDQVFAVMALAPRHTFQVLTKRPERMRAYLTARSRSADPWKAAARTLGYALEFEGVSLVPFPLPNFWLGVSVENQRFADERIPLLLQTPAAVRFISAEPLLGPITILREWRGLGHAHSGQADDPEVCCCGRARLLHTRLDWVIGGGESGPSARLSHPDWFRSLRDQCIAAGVPYFHKQNGEWLPFYDRDKDDPDWRDVPKEGPRVKRMNLAGGCGFHGERVVYVKRVGKKAAGRLLDGQEWNQFPEVRT